MTARAESIMSAIETTITGLGLTGANVQRGQIYRNESDRLPALSLFMGDDQVASEYQTGLLDWELSVFIQSTVLIEADYTTYAATLETSINAVREQLHAALLADHTLGLGYVVDVIPVAASRPDLAGEGDKPTASQTLEYTVRYRTSRADIGA